MVMTSSKSRSKTQSANLVSIKTSTNNIAPSQQEKLLGCWVQEDLKWLYHIMESEDNLYTVLNKRLNALKLISKSCDFKTRKMFGYGIFHSKLIYMICVWGHCSKEILQSLQTIQNRAARIISRNKWDVSNKENFKHIGWLSVCQLVQYHCVLLLHQVKLNKSPEYIYSMFDWNYSHQTRQTTNSVIKPIGTPRLGLSQKSFRWQAPKFYNNLPKELTQITEMKSFKIKLKQWIAENVPFK